jgi:hypothetical protein
MRLNTIAQIQIASLIRRNMGAAVPQPSRILSSTIWRKTPLADSVFTQYSVQNSLLLQ